MTADLDLVAPLFRTVFEQSPVSTQVFASDGTTIAVNSAFERLWGVTFEQIAGYNILQDQQLVGKEIMPFIRRGFAGEAVIIPPIQYVPDETIPNLSDLPFRWVAASIYPIKDEQGTVREVVLMHQDITEQKRAEEALQESEERFRAIFDSAPVGISMIDRDGHYIAVNPAREEMLGVATGEIVGRHYLDFTFSDDVPYDVEVNQRAREEGENRYQLEKRFVLPDGSVRWDRITVRPVRDQRGELLYSISVAEDITSQHNLEQQKDDFLSAAAHDLRTPLTTMKGRIQLLRRRVQQGHLDMEQTIADLDRIDAGLTRMATLINELLDVANLQIGRPMVLNRTETDLVALVGEVVGEQHQVSERHGIELQTSLPEVRGFWDATRVERVLANLLSNAVKYSPSGGEITISIDVEGDWVILSVADRGIGVPPADLPHVFDRFRRGENVAAKIPGTGIGLAAVRDIVEQHGGSVSATNREGGGSIFTVRLPRREL